MKNLKKRYPEFFEQEITEKEIIYISRNVLSYYEKDNRHLFEPELFKLIQSKEWNWHHVDIDKCNILLYPIWNQAFQISDYLIENKYDLSVSKPDVIQALSSCVRMHNLDYFEKILKQPHLHDDYKVDIIIKTILIVSHNKKDFFPYLQKIEQLNPDFSNEMMEKVILGVIKDRNANTWLTVLNSSLTPPAVTKEITDQILENYKYISKEMKHAYELWSLNQHLEKELVVRNQKNNRKI